MALQFPDISPVAISLGPLDIRWYALAYLAGLLLGWRYVAALVGKDEAKDHRFSRIEIDDFLGWAVVGVILGGRLGYVLFYQFDMYLSDPMSILRVWEGGMSFHGGALGVIIAMIIFSWRRKKNVLRLTDPVCAAVPIGLFFGRIANFVNGELFGRVTNMPWGIAFPNGGPEPRHPSQLYEAALEGAVLFFVLFFLARNDKIRNRPGIVSGVFLIGYGLSRMFIEFFRQPDPQIGYIAQYFTMGQILCVPMLLGGAYLIHFANSRAKRAKSENGKTA